VAPDHGRVLGPGGARQHGRPHGSCCRGSEAASGRPVRVLSRPESASAATGSARAHVLEQRALLEEAFGTGTAVEVE